MSRSLPLNFSDHPLGGRYKVLSLLGVGGFGQTFLANDLHLPGHPICVVKQLKPEITNDHTLQMARRCFNTEAEVLYQLGNHEQIPRLLAHFEDNQEFYLAQEFIEGQPLAKELIEGQPWPEDQVIHLLKDILQILTFVHQQQVIHRDIKPSNLIRRKKDGKIELIDFGAVKQVGTQGSVDPETGLTNVTISIGTKGYMPNEQLAGKPRFSSDIYAVGIIGIQALTGVHPRHFEEDARGELAWYDRTSQVSPGLMATLDRMVRYDFRERYPTAIEALNALSVLPLEAFTPVSKHGTSNGYSDNGDSGNGHSGHGRSSNGYSGSQSGNGHSSNGHSGNGESVGDYATAFQGATYLQVRDASGEVYKEFSQSGATGRRRSPLIKEQSPEEEAAAPPTAIWQDSASAEGRNGQPGSSSHRSGTTGSSTHMATQAIGRPRPASGVHGATGGGLTSEKSPWRLPIAISVGAIAAIGIIFSLAQQYEAKGNSSQAVLNAVTPHSAPSATPKEQAADLAKQARQSMNQGKFSDALGLYDKAIALQSTLLEANVGRCEALNRLNRPEEAIVSCNDALAYKANYPDALLSKANSLFLQDKKIEALKLYEEVSDRNPKLPQGWLKRGVTLQDLGRSAEALTALEKSIALHRNSAEAWATKGEALVSLQRYEEAITSFNKALQLRPNDSKIIKLREQARELQGS
ncbi:MAG: tetratricopeptide repeat protein [Oculatellaceae cyanobacterium Prado106]|jgi:serine/threonine protein kinase/Flp pilus assembly protein TadD|nr:tetratricopeptide repeat protein [Oculatellaceae cyanobacterium Prado106]